MSIKKAVILGIILEILLGAAAASFYFLYYVKDVQGYAAGGRGVSADHGGSG